MELKMKIANVIRKMKEINPDKLLIVKIGEFYYLYGKDSYIISYILAYKIQYVENIPYVSFPKSAVNKVLNRVENENIDYVIINKNRNYEEIERYKTNKNNYIELFKKAQIYIKIKRKIDNIYNELIKRIKFKNINEVLNRIEELIKEI